MRNPTTATLALATTNPARANIETHIDSQLDRATAWPISLDLGRLRSGWSIDDITAVLATYAAAGWVTTQDGYRVTIRPASAV